MMKCNHSLLQFCLYLWTPISLNALRSKHDRLIALMLSSDNGLPEPPLSCLSSLSNSSYMLSSYLWDFPAACFMCACIFALSHSLCVAPLNNDHCPEFALSPQGKLQRLVLFLGLCFGCWPPVFLLFHGSVVISFLHLAYYFVLNKMWLLNSTLLSDSFAIPVYRWQSFLLYVIKLQFSFSPHKVLLVLYIDSMFQNRK